MASTKLEAAISYVKGKLEEAEALKGATVLWGPPVGDDRPAQVICVGFGPEGESGSSSREWKNLGGEKLEEDLTIELMVEVLQIGGGADLQPAYTASVELAEAVEDVIRTDETLGGLLMLPARLSTWRGQYVKVDPGRGHRVFMTLTGSARI